MYINVYVCITCKGLKICERCCGLRKVAGMYPSKFH